LCEVAVAAALATGFQENRSVRAAALAGAAAASVAALAVTGGGLGDALSSRAGAGAGLVAGAADRLVELLRALMGVTTPCRRLRNGRPIPDDDCEEEDTGDDDDDDDDASDGKEEGGHALRARTEDPALLRAGRVGTVAGAAAGTVVGIAIPLAAGMAGAVVYQQRERI
jgi:hypothetical protein